MRAAVILFVLSAPMFGQIVGPHRKIFAASSCGAFAHCYSLTYDHTQAGSADTSSFPALVYFSAATLKDTGHSGYANSSAGADILFYSDAGLTTQIASELEYYDNVNGVGWFWVNIASLSHTADGHIYMGVGNASPASRTSGVWDANYIGVWHFGTTSGLLADSTGSYGLTPGVATAAPGQLDGGFASFAYTTASLTMGTTVTMECWEDTTSADANEMFVEKSPVNAQWELFHTGSGANALVLRGGNTSTPLTTTMPASGWHYLVATITGSAGQIYVDNNASVSGPVDAAGNTNTQINIGSYDQGSGFQLIGVLDEVRVSNIVRSASYVTATYNNGLTPGNIGSAGFWTWALVQ